MNLIKNMEAVIVLALGLIMATGVATAAAPAKHGAAPTVIAVGDAPVAVVTITAKRLSAAEKAAL
ncbi:MAG: hypothetical protein V4463_06900 [Pseudomonadota bacterium]